MDLGKGPRYKRRKTSLNPMLSSLQKTSYGALNSTVRDENESARTIRLPPFINSQSRGITAEHPGTNPASGSINAFQTTKAQDSGGFFPQFSQTSYQGRRPVALKDNLNENSMCSSRNHGEYKRGTAKFKERSKSNIPDLGLKIMISNKVQSSLDPSTESKGSLRPFDRS